MTPRTRQLAMALFVLVFGFTTSAAIPDHKMSATQEKDTQLSHSELELAIMALRLPVKNRLKALKQQGKTSVFALQKLSFNSKKSLQVRWRALMALGRLAPETARSTLTKAVKSEEWFMRNAGILAMVHGDRDYAIQWARKLLNDKALVVRTGAVQTLSKLGAIETERLLWKKLDAPENFKNGKSLWVRKHIVKLLSRFARKDQVPRFVRLLKDEDERLHPFALKALKKITGESVGQGAENFQQQRRAWLDWWQATRS